MKFTLKKSLIFKNDNLRNLIKNSFENYKKTIFEQSKIFYFLKKIKVKLNCKNEDLIKKIEEIIFNKTLTIIDLYGN